MHIVRVKTNENDKAKWLEVPHRFSDRVYKGDTVMCEIDGKIFTGVTTTNVMHGDGVEELLSQKREHFEHLRVIGKKTYVSMSAITVPVIFNNSRPDKEKLFTRITELYTRGKFDTFVKFTKDLHLLDGYSAYLVARMFDHEKLEGFVMFE